MSPGHVCPLPLTSSNFPSVCSPDDLCAPPDGWAHWVASFPRRAEAEPKTLCILVISHTWAHRGSSSNQFPAQTMPLAQRHWDFLRIWCGIQNEEIDQTPDDLYLQWGTAVSLSWANIFVLAH